MSNTAVVDEAGAGRGRADTGRDVDVVVVGGGHNGLICAAYLARAGVATMLLEARDEVGGCASTVSDLDARFNICSCDHTLVRAMPFMEDLDLAAHGLSYLEADPATVYLDYDGSPPWLFFNDSERTIESIGRHRPSAAKAYRRYLTDARPVAELSLEMSAGPASTPKMLARLLARRGRGGVRLLQWSRASALDVMRSYFDDEALIMPAMSNGPGAALRGGSPVAGLLGDGRRVRGVRLADGTEIAAGAVVATCDPVPVASHWLAEPHSARVRRFVGRARSQAPGDGYQSKIDAVITDIPRYPALEDSKLLDLFEGRDTAQSNYVMSPSIEELIEAHRLRPLGRVAEHPTMMANVPSVLDPSMRSGDGHHVLSLEALFTPYNIEGGWDGSPEPARWLKVWSSLLQPGFLESVDRYRTMTPDRYERELFLGRGYTPSYAGSPLSSLLGRRRELSRYRAPVPGLFLSGAGTYPGAGIWGASGRNAAQVVLRTLQ